MEIEESKLQSSVQCTPTPGNANDTYSELIKPLLFCRLLYDKYYETFFYPQLMICVFVLLQVLFAPVTLCWAAGWFVWACGPSP